MYFDKLPVQRKILVLCEGKFGQLTSKTANAVIRYQPETVVGVIDSRLSGKTAQEIIGCGGDIPVVGSLEEGLALSPNILLIGIAPGGGRLPSDWVHLIRRAIENKLHIINGLHTFLRDIPELEKAAQEHGIEIVDVRRIPDEYKVVTKGLWETRKPRTILTVGTDVNIGKKTASLEIYFEMKRRNRKPVFVATGQTGIILAGRGIAVDAIVSDFVAGAIEKEIERSIADDTEYVLVEGQGSIIHQGYSGVTLGLIHGTMPDAMIMCHIASRNVDQDYKRPYPEMRRLIEIHEMLVNLFKPSKVIGIGLNTWGLSESEAIAASQRYEDATGLPTTDPYRFGAEKLVDAIEKYFTEVHVE